jgi:hypothetical protein
MLIPLSAAAAVIALDLTGMPPQVSEIRAIAAEHHLPLLCNGVEGDQQVVRVGLPRGQSTREYVDLQEQFESISSRLRAIDAAEAASRRCDYEPADFHSEGSPFGDSLLASATSDLTFGPAELLQMFKPIAIACGFDHTFIRPLDEIDHRFIGMATNVSKIQPDWVVLDAGEQVAGRYGPQVCFLKLGQRTAHPTRAGK